MSKIICDVCGTTYPDTASQCPICGCATPQPRETTDADSAAEEQSGAYTYVKGGRFSKSNVRKRTKNGKTLPVYAEEAPEEPSGEESSNRGLTIAIIVLLLAIIAVAVYIYVKFFAPSTPNPGKDLPNPSESQSQSQTTTEQTNPTETDPSVPETTETTLPPEIPCEAINLNKTELSFAALEETFQLTADIQPAGTTDIVSYTSSNSQVASVSATGLVTAVGEGTAEVTVSCGEIQSVCTVTVTVEKEKLNVKLSKTDMTLYLDHPEYASSWQIYLVLQDTGDRAEIDAGELVWSSQNTNICTVTKNGTVKAVSKGTTTVTCSYGGETYTCTVHVD